MSTARAIRPPVVLAAHDAGTADPAQGDPALGHDAPMSTPDYPPRPDLRRRALAGEALVGLWLNLGSLQGADILARAGFDWVVVDLEHGMGSEQEVFGQLVAIQASSTAAIARVATAERIRIGRLLDLGVDGLVIPRLESVEAIRETVSWMRYPPAGIRGVATGTRGAGYGAIPHPQVHTIDDRVAGVFQLESRLAVEACEEIAAVDGVDVLFVGPADLSHDLRIPGQFDHPEFIAALDRVAAAAKAHGKAAGILLRDASEVAAYAARGYTFIGVGSDSGVLAAGARSLVMGARAGFG
jgi:2-keto-3-deoxy-L-rhamnonate aldolase RhmA